MNTKLCEDNPIEIVHYSSDPSFDHYFDNLTQISIRNSTFWIYSVLTWFLTQCLETSKYVNLLEIIFYYLDHFKKLIYLELVDYIYEWLLNYWFLMLLKIHPNEEHKILCSNEKRFLRFIAELFITKLFSNILRF